MIRPRPLFTQKIFRMGGCLYPSFFLLCSFAFADTVTLKNDRPLKGIVVERHVDRIILSTASGEIPIHTSGIKNISYDDPEKNFMSTGLAYEAQGKFGEALAYYEKALELNPNFEEARRASAAVRSRFWAKSTEGPQSAIEKQQALYDSWGEGPDAMAKVIKKKSNELKERLRKNLGVTLGKKGDWVVVEGVASGKESATVGLKRGDRLISIDADSLRFLSVEVVAKKMLEPRFTSFTLDIERDRVLKKAAASAKELGFKLKLAPDGVMIESVQLGSAADQCGLAPEDFVAAVDGVSTRYLPIGKIKSLIEDRSKPATALIVRRSVFLTRR